MNTDPSLNPFFDPQGVVVIGASSDPTKLGYGLARNLVQSNYQGAIHFVNIKGGRLLNRPIYTTVAEVPDPVDLAAILIPAPFVPGVLRDCGERGIQAVIIGAGGFREVSPEGAALEEKCLQIAAHYGIRLIGPNCIGILDTHLPIDTTFLPPPGPTPGDVAFALAPLTEPEATYLLENTWAGRKLAGYRNLPPADRAATLDVLYRLARLAADFHQLAEIEINPLRVLAAGAGAVAVDVRLRLAER